MYGKIFDSMYDGTLVEDWRALITFQQMIVLCDADGTVDMTPHAISRRTGIPIEHIEAGIRILENPDPYSRTPSENGCRIQRLDDHRPWGWTIVNHEKYKTLQDFDTVRAQNRERQRRFREKQKEGVTLRNVIVTHDNAESRHTNKDTNENTNKRKKTLVDKSTGFDEFWAQYPKNRNKKKALEIWKRKNLHVLGVDIVQDVINRVTMDQRWVDGYIPDATTYLNGERWEDELSDTRGKRKLTYAEQLAADLKAKEK